MHGVNSEDLDAHDTSAAQADKEEYVVLMDQRPGSMASKRLKESGEEEAVAEGKWGASWFEQVGRAGRRGGGGRGDPGGLEG